MNKTVTVEVEPVRYKAASVTDATMFRIAAGKLDRNMHVGGSNLREAIATLLTRTADALDQIDPPPPQTVWDQGDPDPGESVQVVATTEITNEDGNEIQFGRTYNADEWKGYVHGGKVYYSWEELVRRYGPVEVVVKK